MGTTPKPHRSREVRTAPEVEDAWKDTVDELCTAGDRSGPTAVVHIRPRSSRQASHRVFRRCSTASAIADADRSRAQAWIRAGGPCREIRRHRHGLHEGAAVTKSPGLAIAKGRVLARSTSRGQPPPRTLVDHTRERRASCADELRRPRRVETRGRQRSPYRDCGAHRASGSGARRRRTISSCMAASSSARRAGSVPSII